MILPGKFCWRRTSAQIREAAPVLTQKCHVIRNAGWNDPPVLMQTYLNLNLDLILTLKPSLNTNNQNASTSQKCTHANIEPLSHTHIPPPSSTTVCVNPGTAAPIVLILFSCLRVWIKHKTHHHIHKKIRIELRILMCLTWGLTNRPFCLLKHTLCCFEF